MEFASLFYIDGKSPSLLSSCVPDIWLLHTLRLRSYLHRGGDSKTSCAALLGMGWESVTIRYFSPTFPMVC